MTKEEVKKAIHFGKPERVPLKTEDFSPETFKKYGDKLWDLLKKYPSDFLIPVPDPPEGWKPKREGEDEYGCVWGHVEGQTGSLVKESPIKDWSDLKDYKFPDPHAPGRLEYIKKCLRVPIDFYMVGGMWGYDLFTRAPYLRGVERLLEDLYAEPEYVNELFDKLTEFYLGLVDEWFKVGADCILYSDELGLSNSLMLSPALFKSMLKGRYKDIFDFCHKKGMDVWFHTCGHIEPLIPDLIECGVDILHNVQDVCNDRVKIAKEYRGKVWFSTSPSGLKTLRNGTPEDVARETKWLIENLGTEDGGFIVCDESTIFPDIPFENIEAMFKTAKEYRY